MQHYFADGWCEIYNGKAECVLPLLPARSVQCCVTSPPYWGLRDYGALGQLGMEKTPEEFVAKLVAIFREVKRVLRDDGTLWLNLGSSYWGGGRGGNPDESDFRKQATNRGSLIKTTDWKAASSGGRQPIRSRGGVPSCGSDGRELQDFHVAGHACPYCGGELQDGSAIRDDYIARTSQPNGQFSRPVSPKAHDSAQQDCEAGLPSALHRGAPASTNAASPESGVTASYHGAKASESPSTGRSFSHGYQESSDNSVCIDGTAQIVHPSSFGMSDTGFFCKACGYCATRFPQFKPKDLVNMPFFVAEALRADGWYLRQEIIWHKPQPMPESVTDRCTKSHEQIFLLAKSSRYYFDAAAIATPCSEAYANDSRWETGPTAENEKNGYALAMAQNPKAVHRVFNGEKPKTVNRRSVWTIPTASLGLEHFASYPPDLARLCIMAGCPAGGTVLDPFFGSGTTGMVCTELRRKSIGIELNPEYCAIAQQRTHVTPGLAL